ncbi:MAG: HNH endonuclease [Actinobacteria bacterium]|nr:MAG: HNH endonuclease [Actinomycetota bacterium]
MTAPVSAPGSTPTGTGATRGPRSCCVRAEYRPRSTRCAVVAGEWLSSYDGRTTEDPAALDIDHVVALAEAWRSGAAAWDDGRRRAFANDLDQPGELVAVTAAANRSKGDHDPASWRPPNRASWCEFGIGWVRTKLKWGLTADRPEVRALDDMLRDCTT